MKGKPEPEGLYFQKHLLYMTRVAPKTPCWPFVPGVLFPGIHILRDVYQSHGGQGLRHSVVSLQSTNKLLPFVIQQVELRRHF